MSAHAIPHVTPEEYLAADRAAEFKSEYFDGQAYAMSGGTLLHSLLATRLVTELNNALVGRRCSVFNSDARVRATASTYVYPDISVVCAQPQVDGKHQDILLNPTLIVEVLSGSTESHDRGLKFARYRQIASLEEYVLVAQFEPRVEIFLRQPDNHWLLSEYFGLESTISFESLGIDLRVSHLYQDVEFSTSAEEN